jgi:two-component system response regulator (stage 0 sporulation protein F)
MSAEPQTRPVILVVDDEEHQRLYYQEELEAAGFAVLTAASGPEALQIVEREPVDLVLLDIAMPGMDGIETLTRLVDLKRDLPVIIITAYSDYHDDFTTWTAAAYVVKSANPAFLHRCIAEVLSKRGVALPPGYPPAD